MKRDDAIAADLQQGLLSPDEDVIGGEREQLRREQVEAFLYEHLTIAAKCRGRMDAAIGWSIPYALDFRAREIAIAAASRQYRALLDLGGEIDPLLDQMAMTEGLKP
jgi:hypothetical protein